jgi:DNA-binding NtrC family response regulator
MTFGGYSQSPVMTETVDMPHILLVGTDVSLLEGLAQSLSAQGHGTRVASSFGEAREMATTIPPLIAVIERSMAAESAGEVLGLTLAPGGAVVLYRSLDDLTAAVPHVLQRHVLAELSLPLERNRLAALVQHVRERATAVGRGRTSGESEKTAQ